MKIQYNITEVSGKRKEQHDNPLTPLLAGLLIRCGRGDPWSFKLRFNSKFEGSSSLVLKKKISLSHWRTPNFVLLINTVFLLKL
ncbi:unnamed protein product [Lactuca virosa]|uniref:Uncharacterized protein n=1 Tax=Lactuca virosa TaxID=75947 RepID=A0AAU9PND5_9ASTR|nr:unnamed protein product [Lactuca virosa]